MVTSSPEFRRSRSDPSRENNRGQNNHASFHHARRGARRAVRRRAGPGSCRRHQGTPVTPPRPATAPPRRRARPGKVVATVGESRSQCELDLADDRLDPQFAKMPADQRRVAALSPLIDISAGEEGRGRRARPDRGIQAADGSCATARCTTPISRTRSSTPITDADVKARYDKEIAASTPEEEVHARHILVKTEGGGQGDHQASSTTAPISPSWRRRSRPARAPQKGGDLGYFTTARWCPNSRRPPSR